MIERNSCYAGIGILLLFFSLMFQRVLCTAYTITFIALSFLSCNALHPSINNSQGTHRFIHHEQCIAMWDALWEFYQCTCQLQNNINNTLRITMVSDDSGHHNTCRCFHQVALNSLPICNMVWKDKHKIEHCIDFLTSWTRRGLNRALECQYN